MNSELITQIKKSLQHLKEELAKLQTGRANAGLLDGITVESYGTSVPLNQVASVSCPDAKTLRIEPWDKSLLGAIEKAIQTAQIGINPQNMGDSIFLPIPPMTQERREAMAKVVRELGEKARISIRSARQEAMKEIKLAQESGDISEDQEKDESALIQKEIDQANQEIDQIVKKKSDEILTV
jgi:ribosome recycling factor